MYRHRHPLASAPRHASPTWRLALALVLAFVSPKPGAAAVADWRWQPEIAPAGPVLVLVSLPDQRASVYRNGVRIGVSPVSTGKPGHETPTGVFTILQKKREHYSNLYDDAPMPFMQRLTWDGIALHAGNVPGYPASHGCVRLPEAFAEKLFEVTSQGMTVVITDRADAAPMLARPALFPSPPPMVAAGTRATDLSLPPPAGASYAWQPGVAPPGALTVVLSTADRSMVVLREGREIGRAPVTVDGAAPAGTRAYLLLDGVRGDVAPVLPERPRRRWLRVLGEGDDDPASALAPAGLGVDPGFVARLYDALAPGATLVVTDEALGQADALTVLQAGDENPTEPPHLEQE